MYLGLHIKCLIFLPRFGQIWVFWHISYQISRKFIEWETRYYIHKDGQTEVTKAMDTFHNCVNASKQINGLSKSKTLSFIFQNVLCLLISYSYFGGIRNATFISIKDWKFMTKSRTCWEKRTCGRSVLL